MSNAPIRTRSDRVATLQIDSFSWYALWHRLIERPVLLRFAMILGAIAIVTVGMQGWDFPFPYHRGYVPPRAIVARVPFEVVDEKKTEVERNEAARVVICFYENNILQLVQLRSGVRNVVLRLTTPQEGDLGPEQLKALEPLLPQAGRDSTLGVAVDPSAAVAAIRSTLTDEKQIEKFDSVIRKVFEPYEQTGLLESLDHTTYEGNQVAIRVFPPGRPQESFEVDVNRVRIVEVVPQLHERLRREMKAAFEGPAAVTLADLVFNYVAPQLPETLKLHDELTQEARAARVAQVKPVKIQYYPSITTIVPGGKPLGASELEVLQVEHTVWLANRSLLQRVVRLAAYIGMLCAISLLCGMFIWYQLDRTLLTDNGKLLRLLGLSVFCILAAAFAAEDAWRAELLPLVFCTLTATIAYGRPLTLMLMSALSLGIALSLGMDIGEFVILLSVVAAATLMLGRIRDRTRLIYVSAGAAAVVAATTIGVGTMIGQVNGIAQEPEAIGVIEHIPTHSSPGAVISPMPNLMSQLGKEAALNAFFTILAGAITFSSLVLIERIFEVQTDLTLLELGDASHPLLRQLAQRAPGTYNHSITVAAIAESAAESIGANGLLTRVGAYFHDIGKMFKPNYFVENQVAGVNCHDALQPAMSTLVIMSHVKDGADLARQHHLPKRFIDFIEQHHGTTLVEYFYRQAAKKSEEQNGVSQLSESTFRYAGPRPQTLEAAVLMLADAVESASRTLVEPTPARLQNLIDQIAMKRLTDGQFDQCGLTLTQLNTVKTALLKSLTAIYHHRIKYDQQSA